MVTNKNLAFRKEAMEFQNLPGLGLLCILIIKEIIPDTDLEKKL